MPLRGGGRRRAGEAVMPDVGRLCRTSGGLFMIATPHPRTPVRPGGDPLVQSSAAGTLARPPPAAPAPGASPKLTHLSGSDGPPRGSGG